MGVMNKNGVGIGDIQAGFDDFGGEEDVEFAFEKFFHDVFQAGAVHLSVGDAASDFGV